jgi:3-oxo-5alpha-steroid 4-dehydrogenase
VPDPTYQAVPGQADSAANAAPVDGTLTIESPLAVNPTQTRWDQSCDVLVVGFGAAGAATAVAANSAGADVLVVDRFDGGGATARSGGVVYAGGGTRHQQAAGYEDTPDAMFRYLRLETGDAVSEPTLRKFCADSVSIIEWLESIGASFESSAPPPKTSYPKNGVYLYYSGNEALPSSLAHAPAAPRGHRMRDAWLSGEALFKVLRGQVERLNIPVQALCGVHRLVTDARNGAVIGAEIWQIEPGSATAKRHRRLTRWAEALHNFVPGIADRIRARVVKLENNEAHRKLVQARQGVVLSAGGFIFNRQMMQQHAPKYLANLRLGATGCDGSGIQLGLSVGGDCARMNRVSAWRFINPPQNWPKGIVVDQQGRRFCNEEAYGARIGVEMCENHEGRAWLIVDSRLRHAAFDEALHAGLWPFQKYPAMFLMALAPRSRSIEALAAKIGVPAANLRDTLDSYNAAIGTKSADAYSKSTGNRQPLDAPPYYALDISAGNATFPCPAITLGGLRVDESSGAVLDRQGRSIPGLYAAGRNAVGVASNHYVSGLSIADCLWSGRRAGTHAASVQTTQTAAARA